MNGKSYLIPIISVGCKQFRLITLWGPGMTNSSKLKLVPSDHRLFETFDPCTLRMMNSLNLESNKHGYLGSEVKWNCFNYQSRMFFLIGLFSKFSHPLTPEMMIRDLLSICRKIDL